MGYAMRITRIAAGLFGAIMLVSALALLALGGSCYNRAAAFKKTAVEAQGAVVELKEGGSGGAQRNERGGDMARRFMRNSLECRFAEGKPLDGDEFQVGLIGRDRTGAFTRNLVVSCAMCMQARTLAGRMAEALRVPFLDSASPERVNRSGRITCAGGGLLKPNEGPSTRS
jgi:hypothetical protein